MGTYSHGLGLGKSSCHLGSGRAGREGPGKCFRLYQEGKFATLADSATPHKIYGLAYLLPILLVLHIKNSQSIGKTRIDPFEKSTSEKSCGGCTNHAGVDINSKLILKIVDKEKLPTYDERSMNTTTPRCFCGVALVNKLEHVPLMLKLPVRMTGVDGWPGKQMHSHTQLRVPEPFRDQIQAPELSLVLALELDVLRLNDDGGMDLSHSLDAMLTRITLWGEAADQLTDEMLKDEQLNVMLKITSTHVKHLVILNAY
ncbi:hypothetical protein MKX01_029834 [Papaver californicum]|nr:hypothetical protein MKX01_029834 [Papaver californicum]